MTKGKKIRRIILIIIAVIVALILAVIGYIQLKGAFDADSLATNTTISNPFIVQNGTDVSAHRMGSSNNPEDTMMAAQWITKEIADKDLKVDIIEVDLSMTKDGELILLHDETLDRTTDAIEHFGSENIYPADYTLKELQELNFGESFTAEDGSTPYKGLRGKDIPDNLKACTIEEILDYLEKDNSFKYIIEIKDSGEIGKAATDKLVSIVDERGLKDKTIIASFNKDVLSYLDEAYPDYHRNASMSEVVDFYKAYILGQEINPSDLKYDVLDITPRYGIFTGTDEFGQEHGLLNLHSQGFLNCAHDKGIAVYYWTVNNEKTMQELINVNSDAIITDVPELASQLTK